MPRSYYFCTRSFKNRRFDCNFIGVTRVGERFTRREDVIDTQFGRGFDLFIE